MSRLNISKLVFLFLFVVLFSVSIASASPSLVKWENFAEINEDGTVNWEVILNYSEPVDKSDYFIFARVYSVRVYSVVDEPLACDLFYKEVGSLIICKDLLPKNLTVLKYRFKTNNQISSFNEFRIFRNGLSIIENIEYFSMVVKLPLGATLVDKSKLIGSPIAPFEPGYGQEGSDGRKILVKWELNKPRLGESINIAVLYETIPVGLDIGIVISILLIFVIISILATYYFKKIRFDIKSFLDVLSEGERKVMEIVIREKKVDQRVIVRETDYSKAKVSRIIQSLTTRGLIDAVPKGRTKLITLKSIRKNVFETFRSVKSGYRIGSLRLSKEQALELARFLTNIIDDLSDRSKELEKKEYTKVKHIKVPQKLYVLYEDVKKLYTNVDDKFIDYNKLAEKIEQLSIKTKHIITKRFGNSFVKILEKNALDDYIAKDFPEFIINNKTKIDTNYSEFWKENCKKILKIRESKLINPLINEIEINSEELEKVIWELKDELINLREEVRKSYNLLVKDFYEK